MKNVLNAQAVYFTGPAELELRKETLSKNGDETLVHSKLMGISHGTERRFYQGNFPRSESADGLASNASRWEYPIKYGYINVGITEEGKRVFAFYPHQDRFYADPSSLINLPDNLGFEDAVFLASMETALSIVQDARPVIGERVLLTGLGVIGLLTAEIIHSFHHVELICCDPLPNRRKKAAEMGIEAFDPEELASTASQRSSNPGMDLSIDTSGSEKGLQTAIDMLGLEGRCLAASWFGDRATSLNLGEAFHRRRVKITSSQVTRIPSEMSARWDKKRRMHVAIKLCQAIRPSKYISRIFPLSEAVRAFDYAMNRSDEVLQVLLRPDSELKE